MRSKNLLRENTTAVTPPNTNRHIRDLPDLLYKQKQGYCTLTSTWTFANTSLTPPSMKVQWNWETELRDVSQGKIFISFQRCCLLRAMPCPHKLHSNRHVRDLPDVIYKQEQCYRTLNSTRTCTNISITARKHKNPYPLPIAFVLHSAW